MLVILTRSFQWCRLISVIGLYVKSWKKHGRVYFLSALETWKSLLFYLPSSFYMFISFLYLYLIYLAFLKLLPFSYDEEICVAWSEKSCKIPGNVPLPCIRNLNWRRKQQLQWGTKVLTHFRKMAPFCVVDILIPFPCLPQPLPPKINVEFWTLKSFFYFRQHWFGGSGDLRPLKGMK